MSEGAAIWMVLGIVVGCAELLIPGVFLIWIGMAAVGVGAAHALWPMPLASQLGVFVVLALLLLAAPLWRRVRNRPRDRVNGPDVDIVGRPCEALAFHGAEGRVRFRDSTWQAEAVDAGVPAIGASLRIVGVRGATLLVAAAPS